MRALSVLLVLINCFSKSFGQFLNPCDFNGHVRERFDVSIYNAADLFDSCEIQDRKIKSAMLLQLYEGTEAADTLYIYYFDSMGEATTQISFVPPSLDVEGDSYVRDKSCNLSEVIPGTKDWYATINYIPHGVERKSYHKRSNEMLDSEFIISRNYGEAFMQTNGRSELIMYPIEEGSCLIGRIVSIQIDESYYVTQYVIKYHDN